MSLPHVERRQFDFIRTSILCITSLPATALYADSSREIQRDVITERIDVRMKSN